MRLTIAGTIVVKRDSLLDNGSGILNEGSGENSILIILECVVDQSQVPLWYLMPAPFEEDNFAPENDSPSIVMFGVSPSVPAIKIPLATFPPAFIVLGATTSTSRPTPLIVRSCVSCRSATT